MLLRSLRAALIVLLCLSIGGHWIALQSVAWGTMIWQHSQQVSLAKAVAQTFSGTDPCDLCKGIAAAQHSQKKDVSQPTARPDLICVTRTITFRPRCVDSSFVEFKASAVPRPQSPPIPPPRFELV